MTSRINNYLFWKSGYTLKAPINYKLHLDRFNAFVKKPIEAVGIEDIVKFQFWLKSKYSMANVAYSITVIKNFFTFYRRQGIACVDPFLIRVPRFTPKSHTPITEEDFLKMDSVLTEHEFFVLEKRVIIRLLWETGIRVSELCDINISDLENRPMAIIKTKKNNKMRWIFWSNETHKFLMQFLGIRLCLNQQSYLFVARNQGRRKRITPRTTERWIKEVAQLAGINKKISPHSFRHGKAHNILDKGGNPKDIQFILGHSENNPRAAFSYLRLNSKEAEKRAKMFL